LLFTFLTAVSQKTLLYCGQFIDVTSGKMLSGMTIVVDGKKISDIQPGYIKAGQNDKVIDLKNRTVMPGLIDMHVHLESETKKGALADKFIKNPADIAFESLKYAQ